MTPATLDYESNDESHYGSSNSEIYIEDFSVILHLFFATSDGIFVSTRSIRWILWFSVRYAAAARREIFGVNALRRKQQQLGSPNLQDIFIGG